MPELNPLHSPPPMPVAMIMQWGRQFPCHEKRCRFILGSGIDARLMFFDPC